MALSSELLGAGKQIDLKDYQMKRTLLKIAVSLLVFFISVFVISKIMNQGNTDMTATMKSATFPLVYMEVNNQNINCLHGYINDIEGNYLRDTITPLQESRSLPIKIKTYGPTIRKMTYEIRSMDMERLVEDTEVTDYSQEDAEGYVSATLYLKDLIEPETEYLLVLKLTSGTGQEIKYYTRIIDPGELYLTEKLDFVNEFHEKTFDREVADDLTTYLEPNEEGDNSSFGNVDIHSSFFQVTWGDLQPRVVTTPDLKIMDMDAEYASIIMTYQVEVDEDLFNVREFYRLRRGTERMYLLEYDRTMDQIFDTGTTILTKDQLLLGISSTPPQLKENLDGSVLCFVKENALYSYNNKTGYLAELFSFTDEENNDERTRYDNHGIKILTVDDDGNVGFLVYGYMNRGDHEGEVGAAVYYYDSAINSIEERIYIPYTKSYELLKQDIECLSFVNAKNEFYLMMDVTIYCIDLVEQTYEEVVTGLTENRFVVADDESIVAWQIGDNIYSSDTIILNDLRRNKITEVTTDSGQTVVPLGFVDEDFIYGIARRSDIARDSMGRTVLPMYSVCIQDAEGNILKEYEQPNIFVTQIEINDNVINLERLQKSSDTGNYTIIANDQIMNNLLETSGKNVIKEVVTAARETILQVTLTRETSYKPSKLLTPKQVLYEGNHSLYFEDDSVKLSRYYVYAHGEIAGVYSEAAEAIIEAGEVSGVVVDDQCAYVWQKGNRASSTRIESIGEAMVTEEKNSLAVCLDAMLANAEVFKNTETLLAEGKTAIEILNENMDVRVLELTGCSLDAVLYYVNKGYPVMVTLGGEECVLIVGYDEKNTILLNPAEGTIAKMGMNDSRELFAEYGNKYVTYIR